jgi:hypothetical protein
MRVAMISMGQQTPDQEPPSLRSILLAEIETFCTTRALSLSEFGRQAVGDVAFVGRLRSGMSIGIDRVDRVRKFMREYRPARRAAK